MKSFIKLMLFVWWRRLFFISGPEGRPLLTLDRLPAPHVSAPDISNTEDSMTEHGDEEGEAPAKPVEVFKWQDENGVWHFSDTQEQEQTAQTVTVDPNASVVHLEALKNPKSEERIAALNNNRHDSSNSDVQAASPFGKIPELISDSKKIRQPQQDHMDRLERAMRD